MSRAVGAWIETKTMKRHLNTLYITSPDAFMRKEGETFVVEINDKKALQAPAHTIENIVCFGFKPVTPALMAFCAENNIGISYLSTSGRFLARVYGEQRGNVLRCRGKAKYFSTVILYRIYLYPVQLEESKYKWYIEE